MKKKLKGLNHRDYEHPFDKVALERLESMSFLKKACKWVTENTVERLFTVQYTGSNLKVTVGNYPKIFSFLTEACEILDLEKRPDLYIQWNYGINAFTIGAENPIVILDSGLLDLCDDDEIRFIIGHECGHIKSNHMLYHMMADVITYVIDAIPGGNLLGGGLQYALFYWQRMSEFTADRAGLLCCQDRDATIRAFIKMSGLPIREFDNLHPETFIQQAHDFKMLDESNMNKFVKMISIANSSHPWTVMRASEILNWMEQGEYTRIINQCQTLKN